MLQGYRVRNKCSIFSFNLVVIYRPLENLQFLQSVRPLNKLFCLQVNEHLKDIMEQEQKLKEHHSAESAGGQKVGVRVKML